MNKKAIIALGFAGVAVIGLALLGRYQRESFRETLRQMHEDFLNYGEGLDSDD